jgi:hypothetical protein
MAGDAELMEVSFVVEELTGPSSLMLPNGSWNSAQQFASGTTPSMAKGTCAKAAIGMKRTVATIDAAIAMKLELV